MPTACSLERWRLQRAELCGRCRFPNPTLLSANGHYKGLLFRSFWRPLSLSLSLSIALHTKALCLEVSSMFASIVGLWPVETMGDFEPH